MADSEFNPLVPGDDTYKDFNPLVSKVGDFTPFYITIAVCAVLLGFILILNVACCCSRYSDYWLDRHTGNRWLVSIWSATPHKQPPLDYTELTTNLQRPHYSPQFSEGRDDYHRLHKEARNVPPSVSLQPLTSSQQYLELHKRESDI